VCVCVQNWSVVSGVLASDRWSLCDVCVCVFRIGQWSVVCRLVTVGQYVMCDVCVFRIGQWSGVCRLVTVGQYVMCVCVCSELVSGQGYVG